MAIDFEQGDEVVVSRYRTIKFKDEEGQEQERVEQTIVSRVRAPDKFKLGGTGGTCLPEYSADPNSELRDRRFLVIRLPMRY